MAKSLIQVGPRVSAGAAAEQPHIADVTNVSVSEPVAVEVEGVVKARFTVGYDAPASLGDGDVKFAGVKLFVHRPGQLVEWDVYTFAGNVGEHVEFTADLAYPSSEQEWIFYVPARSDKYQNPVLAGSTPSATVTVPASPVSGPAPDVRMFAAGTANPDGTFLSTPRWDTLNERMLIDWACLLPEVVLNWSKLMVYIRTPLGDYVQATGPILRNDFAPADAGPVHYDTIAISGGDLPATPEQWQIIACSYSRAGVPNTDENDNPTGPSVTITTLTKGEIPNFNAPGPVRNADFQTAISGVNELTITAMYDLPNTGGPVEGVQLLLSRPGTIDEDLGLYPVSGTGRQYITVPHPTPPAVEQWVLTYKGFGKNHTGSSSVVVSKPVSPYPPATQIGAGVTAQTNTKLDDAGLELYNFTGTFPVPTDDYFDFCRIYLKQTDTGFEQWLTDSRDGTFSTDYWRKSGAVEHFEFRFYAVNLAGQVNTSNPPTASVTVQPSQPGSAGTERAAAVIGFTAAVGYDRDEGGSQRYYLYGSWTNPSDAKYKGVNLYYLPSGGTHPILLASECDGAVKFRTDSWPCPADETGEIYALSIDAANRENTKKAGTTPSVTVHITRQVGGTGQEYAPVVGDFNAQLFTAYDEVGGQRYGFACTWNLPSDRSSYRGLKLVARPSGTSGAADIPLATVNETDTSCRTQTFPMPESAEGFYILPLSVDANNRVNTYASGTTPEIYVVVQPSGTGNLKIGSRAAAGQLGKGLSTLSGQIYIPSQAIDNTLLALNSVFTANLYNGPVIFGQHLSDYIVGQQKLANAPIIDMARIVDGSVSRLKIGLGVIDHTLIADAGIYSANIASLNVSKLDVVGGTINCSSGTLVLSGAQGVSISNGGNLSITPGALIADQVKALAAGSGWTLHGGPIGSYISGPGYINANGGFQVNGVAGITTTVGFVDSGGNGHNLYFTGGILTGIS